MRILVVGSAGREHAIVRHLAQSPLTSALFCAPGNGGISELAACPAIAATDVDGICNFCVAQRVDLVIVGTVAPLVAGLADALRRLKIAVVGPNSNQAKLESSKAFTKELCHRLGIRTPASRIFDSYDAAEQYIKSRALFPLVIKADGLAAGMGVSISHSVSEACAAAEWAISHSKIVLIEDYVTGREISFFILSDGEHYRFLETARDYKRLSDGDLGPNTAGMGCYSPAFTTADLKDRICKEIVEPILQFFKDQDDPYRGFLYAGIMVDDKGPQLLEFNVRLGDPEAQVLFARLKSDILPVLRCAVLGELEKAEPIVWSPDPALCVTLASNRYPQDLGIGQFPIVASSGDARVVAFHGATRRVKEAFYGVGGRVLHLVASAHDLDECRNLVYASVQRLAWEGAKFRTDIGVSEELPGNQSGSE